MSESESTPSSVRWARLRFAIIAPLLASPPAHGELGARIAELCARRWKHPTTGDLERFGFKTIERWYYLARDAKDPVLALARKVPRHAGTHPAISPPLALAIRTQHAAHPRWSYQLHHDNLCALAKERPELAPMPAYPTVRRYMKAQGLYRQKKKRGARRGNGELQVISKETRSYEVEHVHQLWHLDFHECSRPVLLPSGEWKKPQLLGLLDDHSRLCCHAQWYLAETAEVLADGLVQAILKRGLPWEVMMDNGSAMKAAEICEGLERLGVAQRLTLENSPQQNGKQESFWGQVEGRLIAMLEGERELTLDLLNRATIAWVEQEYQRSTHSEIGTSPLDRYLSSKNVGRESPSLDTLRRALRMQVRRAQRRSDGTVSVEAVRFEVPSAYRTLTSLTLRVARWDLSSVHLVDPRTEAHLATLLPLDKRANADGRRRATSVASNAPAPPATGIAPLLRSLMAEYAATGLPPAYLPQHDHDEPDDDEGETP